LALYSVRAAPLKIFYGTHLVANTRLESTGRYGVELGYYVTFLKDTTSVLRKQAYHSAVDINWPAFAHAILTTREFIQKLKTD
jgi:nicotinamidase-related amidase